MPSQKKIPDRFKIGDVVRLNPKKVSAQTVIEKWGEYWQVVNLQLLHKRNKHVALAITDLELTLSPFTMDKKQPNAKRVPKKPQHPFIGIKEMDDYDFDIVDLWCFMMPITNAEG